MTHAPVSRQVLFALGFLAASGLVAPLPGRAQEFQIVGARALAMGGAQVAAVQDETAVYWNPAALALAGEPLSVFEGEPPKKGEPAHGSLGIAVTPGLTSLDHTTEVLSEVADLFNNPTATSEEITRTVNRLKNGIEGGDFGANVLWNSSFFFHYGYFGFGVVSVLDAAGVPRCTGGAACPEDLEGIDLEDLPVEVAYNGGLFLEVPFAASYPIFDAVSVGGAIKYIYGETLADAVPVDENFDSSQYFENLFDRTKVSHNFGVDLGLLIHDQWLAVGVLARNLNAPSFDLPGGSEALGLPGSIELHRQVRVGVTARPNEFILFAADLDLIPNPTLVSDLRLVDYKAQNVAAGIELWPIPEIALRGGFFWNVAESALGPVLTVGLGTNLAGLALDLAGAFALGSTEIQGYTVTEEMHVSVGLAYRW